MFFLIITSFTFCIPYVTLRPSQSLASIQWEIDNGTEGDKLDVDSFVFRFLQYLAYEFAVECSSLYYRHTSFLTLSKFSRQLRSKFIIGIIALVTAAYLFIFAAASFF